jgi:hypothetical protein
MSSLGMLCRREGQREREKAKRERGRKRVREKGSERGIGESLVCWYGGHAYMDLGVGVRVG